MLPTAHPQAHPEMNFTLYNPYIMIELDLATNSLYFNPCARVTFPSLVAVGSKHPIFIDVLNHIKNILNENNELIIFSREVVFSEHTYEQNIYCSLSEKKLRIYMNDVTPYKHVSSSTMNADQLCPEENVLTKKIPHSEFFQKSTSDILTSLKYTSIGIWHWDIEKDIIHWNDCMYQLFFLDKSVIPTWEVFISIVHPNDREDISNELKKSYKSNNGMYNVKFRLNPKNKLAVNHLILARGKMILDSYARPVQMTGICIDIT